MIMQESVAPVVDLHEETKFYVFGILYFLLEELRFIKKKKMLSLKYDFSFKLFKLRRI